MRQAKVVVVLLGLMTFAPGQGLAAPSEREQRLLQLGSAMGSQRLEILAWPQAGEAFRVRPTPADPFDRERPVKSRFRDLDVLDTKRLTETQVKGLAGALLDTEVYDGLGIRRPVPPSGVGRGAGKMCGGFRPIVGIQFRDAEDRRLDVLLCFSCNEVAFASVKSSGGSITDETRHLWISPRGAVRLIRDLAELFPDDKLIGWLKKDRQTRPADAGAVQPGVAADGAAPRR